MAKSTKAHLYLGEWLMYRGLRPADVVKAGITDKAHISRLINNEFETSPAPETLRKLANYLNVKVEDLWQDPFDIIEQRKMHTRLDLEDWLTDPRATIFNEIATNEVRDHIRELAKLIVKKQRGQ